MNDFDELYSFTTSVTSVTSEDQCIRGTVAVSVVLCLVLLSFLIFCVYLLRKFFVLRKIQKMKRKMYWLSSTFFVLVVSSITSFFGVWLTDCIPGAEKFNEMLWNSGQTTYFVQYLLLVWLLFYRLQVAFDNTAYRMSRALRYTFYISFVLTLVLFSLTLLSVFEGQFYSLVGLIVNVMAYVCSLVFMVTLFGSFVYKLITVSKGTKHDGGKETAFLNTIIRTTLLSLVSVLSLLVFTALIALRWVVNQDRSFVLLSIVGGIAGSADLVVNFLSIMLGFKGFDLLYNALCGGCHSHCAMCCRADQNKVFPSSPTSAAVTNTHSGIEVVSV